MQIVGSAWYYHHTLKLETDMSKAQTDIRATSYNAATANPYGYMGTIDDAIAQIRAEDDEVRAPWTLNISRERFELLGFLNTLTARAGFGPAYRAFMSKVEDDSVAYGAPEVSREPGKWSLAYAQKLWPKCFAKTQALRSGKQTVTQS
jgi:hypothetical protein